MNDSLFTLNGREKKLHLRKLVIDFTNTKLKEGSNKIPTKELYEIRDNVNIYSLYKLTQLANKFKLKI